MGRFFRRLVSPPGDNDLLLAQQEPHQQEQGEGLPPLVLRRTAVPLDVPPPFLLKPQQPQPEQQHLLIIDSSQ